MGTTPLRLNSIRYRTEQNPEQNRRQHEADRDWISHTPQPAQHHRCHGTMALPFRQRLLWCPFTSKAPPTVLPSRETCDGLFDHRSAKTALSSAYECYGEAQSP